MKIVEKYAVRNTVLNAAAEGVWGFGSALHSINAIIPLFLAKQGAPEWIIGALPGIMMVFLSLPQLLVTFRVRHISNIIRTNMLVHYLLALPVLALWLLFGVAGVSGTAGWISYMAVYLVFSLGIGLIMPFWILFIERVSVEKKRGRFLGITFTITGLAGMAGGSTAAWILADKSLNFPQNFGVLFGIFALCILAGTTFFAGIRTDAELNTISLPKQTLREFLSAMREMMTGDRSYRNYIISRIFFMSQFLIHSLVAVYGHDKLGFDIEQAGIFTAITLVMSSIANYFAGILGDRFGYKYIKAAVYGTYALAAFSVTAVSSIGQLYGIFALIGLAQGITGTGHMNMIIEFSRGKDTRMYYAVVDSLQSAVLPVLMVLSSLVSIFAGYQVLFPVAGTALLIAFYIIVKKV